MAASVALALFVEAILPSSGGRQWDQERSADGRYFCEFYLSIEESSGFVASDPSRSMIIPIAGGVFEEKTLAIIEM